MKWLVGRHLNRYAAHLACCAHPFGSAKLRFKTGCRAAGDGQFRVDKSVEIFPYTSGRGCERSLWVEREWIESWNLNLVFRPRARALSYAIRWNGRFPMVLSFNSDSGKPLRLLCGILWMPTFFAAYLPPLVIASNLAFFGEVFGSFTWSRPFLLICEQRVDSAAVMYM